MDNFDHDENTMSGKNGSHETMLMLFQNNDVDKPPQDIIHNVPENFKTTEDERTLHYILPCHLLNKGRNVGKRGEIEDDFVPAGEFIDMKQKISWDHFLIWSATRSKPQNTTIQFVPSFHAVNSFFDLKLNVITRFAFTPIILHPAAKYDAIFTCVSNFQDVFLQRDLEYGPL